MITVASIPTAHRYVEHLDAPQGPSVIRLPDPTPSDAGPGDTRWWPPRFLEPEWLESALGTFDLMHIHFGFDSIPAERLVDVTRMLRAADTPLVLTVHDLHNPHFVDNTVHLQHLDVLVPAADRVLTLTNGAADVIEQRWGVRPTVVPHPHVVPLDRIGARRAVADRFVIGVHAKSLRANLDPLAIMDTVVSAAAHCPGASVRLDIDDNLAESPARDALVAYGELADVDVRVHPRFDDEELWEYLGSVDVSILPYRFGTHSGWLEACHDLGTAVIAPDCGYFADQKPCHVYRFGVERFDPASLTTAVLDAYAGRGREAAASRAGRTAERTTIAEIHDRVYSDALARRGDVGAAEG